MIELATYITAQRVHCLDAISSKKRALEVVSELLAAPDLDDSSAIFACLAQREKLGSTSLGHGVAMPHARISDISCPRLALLSVRQGIDYGEASETGSVHLLAALVVPTEKSDMHLVLLQQLAQILRDKQNRAQLLAITDSDRLYKQFILQAATGGDDS